MVTSFDPERSRTLDADEPKASVKSLLRGILSVLVHSDGGSGNVAPGPAPSASYVHTQPIAASNWAINHNLGFRPDITLLNSGSAEIEGEIVHMSNNLAVAIFVTPVAGMARCH